MSARLKSIAFAVAIFAAIAASRWLARSQESPSDPLADFFNSTITTLILPERDVDPPDVQIIGCG